jgi:hypothetical protein
MQPKELSDTQRIKDQIETWLGRAAMAYQQRNLDLTKQALNYRWQYQIRLAELEGTEPTAPPAEPDEFFRSLDRGQGPGRGPVDRDPDQPAPVPRRPLPNAGAGAISLPLPDASTKDES